MKQNVNGEFEGGLWEVVYTLNQDGYTVEFGSQIMFPGAKKEGMVNVRVKQGGYGAQIKLGPVDQYTDKDICEQLRDVLIEAYKQVEEEKRKERGKS